LGTPHHRHRAEDNRTIRRILKRGEGPLRVPSCSWHLESGGRGILQLRTEVYGSAPRLLLGTLPTVHSLLLFRAPHPIHHLAAYRLQKYRTGAQDHQPTLRYLIPPSIGITNLLFRFSSSAFQVGDEDPQSRYHHESRGQLSWRTIRIPAAPQISLKKDGLHAIFRLLWCVACPKKKRRSNLHINQHSSPVLSSYWIFRDGEMATVFVPDH
jgi:hypothetical protein